jgi:hypothetical protein
MPRKYKRPAAEEHPVSPLENNHTVATLEPEPELLLRIMKEKEFREALLAHEQGKTIIARTLARMEGNTQRFHDIQDNGGHGVVMSGYARLRTTEKHQLEEDFRTGLALLDYAWNYYGRMQDQLPPEKEN